MNTVDVERFRQMKTLPSLVKFLRDELDWPVEADEIDELTFDYTSEELGLDAKYTKMIKEIKQIRPLDSQQPWGIFWVNFKKKRLPMVVLRRILGSLVIKRRASARKTDRPSWHLNDLLFISSYGEEEHRSISFAHFAEEPDTNQLPVLRVLGWDDRKSIMNLDRVANRLHSHLRWPAESKAADAWRKRWSDAFTDRYREAIRSADELIPRLAALAAGVRVRVRDVLHAETERGPMRRLFAAVQKLLIHNMNEDGFADMYAQTVAYGLLSARFSRPEGLTAQNLVQLTAVSNPFLENLLDNLFRLNRGKFHFDVDEVGINDVLDLLRNTNIEAIKAAFSDKNPAEDPVIRFYEGFLKQYDPQQRIQRGVFFTPRPVVSYIVRSVHELLQTEFGLEDGLASTATWADVRQRFQNLTIPKGAKPDDPFVCILDPAVGTGTFLFECIEVIERTMKEKWRCQLGKQGWSDPEIIKRWREYVPKHLLPRLYGYELMMAPYTIAHLKLVLKLGETGYQFQEKDRLHVYLTNSLEPPSKQADVQLADLFTALATEAQEVNEIKLSKRFTAVIGNPPYAQMSQNLGEQQRALVSPYRSVDGVRIRERGAITFERNLQDDYIKFIRFSEICVTAAGLGISGLITNHAYLSNITLRGVRCHLMSSFGRIKVLDLHGNSKIHEQPPTGGVDKNVFDIQQGVAVSFFVRRIDNGKPFVSYAETWGSREEKYAKLLELDSIGEGEPVLPEPPNYLFVARDTELAHEYEAWPQLNDIFDVFGSAITTARDGTVVDFEDQPIVQRVKVFQDSRLSDEQVLEKLNLRESAIWNVTGARLKLRGVSIQKYLTDVAYRPFDIRRLFYHNALVSSPRHPTMDHMKGKLNVALAVCRQQCVPGFRHVFLSTVILDEGLVSNRSREKTVTFPLYLIDDERSRLLQGAAENANVQAKIIKIVEQQLQLKWLPQGQGTLSASGTFGPEDLLHYVYAVLHSPQYRERYVESLKTDFPRVPLTAELELFRTLARRGDELVALHLMETPKLDDQTTTLVGSGDFQVEKVSYSDETVWIDKAKTRGFRNVPEEVWNFYIGGYQVCEKWLKDRQAKGGKKPRPGRVLSEEDIDHYQKIVVAINETIKIMKQIDKVIDAHGGWPIK